MALPPGALRAHFDQARATGSGIYHAADLALAATVRELVRLRHGGQLLAALVAQADAVAQAARPDGVEGIADEPLMSVTEVAAVCGVSRHTVYHWNRAGNGPARLRVGRYSRYRRSDVEAFLASRRVA